MPFRNDIPDVAVLGVFQKLDHGEDVSVLVPSRYHVTSGDTVGWVAAQYDGFAEVVSVAPSNLEGEDWCVIRKVRWYYARDGVRPQGPTLSWALSYTNKSIAIINS